MKNPNSAFTEICKVMEENNFFDCATSETYLKLRRLMDNYISTDELAHYIWFCTSSQDITHGEIKSKILPIVKKYSAN